MTLKNLQTKQTLCLRGFSLCNCLECNLIKSYRQTENNLSELNNKINKISDLFRAYEKKINKLKNKNDSIHYEFINYYYDNYTKSLMKTNEELDKKRQRLIYRLNSLENKADLFGLNLRDLNC